MFSYISPNKRVPQDHPLRRIRVIVDRVLEQLSPRFNKLYARAGRPSIAPEKTWKCRSRRAHCACSATRKLSERVAVLKSRLHSLTPIGQSLNECIRLFAIVIDALSVLPTRPPV